MNTNNLNKITDNPYKLETNSDNITKDIFNFGPM